MQNLNKYPDYIKKKIINGKLTNKQAIHSIDATESEEYEDEYDAGFRKR